MGLLAYLLMFWAASFVYHEWLSSKRQKLRRRVKQLRNRLKEQLRWDSDILKPAEREKLEERLAALIAINPKETSTEELAKLTDSSTRTYSAIYAKKHRWQHVRETVELVVVVFGVVAGLRGLFLQPFKIPTGSMQPTLYGIHFNEQDQLDVPGPIGQVLDWCNYSRRYSEEIVQADGYYDTDSVRSRTKFLFFPETSLQIGDNTYTFPGQPHNVMRYINGPDNNRGYFQEGHVLSRGFLLMGDHLFVDRIRYNFVDPKRGDIAVFITDGITKADGTPLQGRYYIKRLVGLPGDTLKIVDRHLYFKPAGATDFQLADQDVHPAFERISSFMGGYQGYSHALGPGRDPQYLTSNNATLTLGDDEFFMLGDNTENSSDSRFWGTVPRSHLVGKAAFVWWPFSRRWGWADRAEPEDYPSPPNSSQD